MYTSFYGLRERPFDLTPNPRFLFLTPKHREALSTLRYGLSTPRGLTLLAGDAGTGKTTLLRAALALEQKSGVRYVLLDNPTLTRAEFYEYLATGFRLSAEAARSKARFLTELRRDVQERHAAGGVTALVIDEAQSLPYDLLEEVRLLANIETSTAKLLNVVLSGQPELADRLNEDALRQLKQRVLLRCELGALSLRETAAYVAGRLRIAGGEHVDQIFAANAIVAVHRLSRGIPRTISVVCENALLGGFALGRKPIDETVVLEVSRDFDLERGALDEPGVVVEPFPETRGPAEPPPGTRMPAAAPPAPRTPVADRGGSVSDERAAAAPRSIAVGDDRPLFAGMAPQKKRRFLFF
jgi:type II secretory pathway predicted ATPase ExeA